MKDGTRRGGLRSVEIGLAARITRRDFVNGALVGAGAALLGMAPPGESVAAPSDPFSALGPDWTGPGGIGAYARSNGNTHEVVNAGHTLRLGKYRQLPRGVRETGEVYDLVVVGGGFAGLGAAHEFRKQRKQGTCLILDNHRMFGGSAKQNEFEVDGHRLWAPQASHAMVGPPAFLKKIGSYNEIYEELGLPEIWQTAQPTGLRRPLTVPPDNYTPQMWHWEAADLGYFFRDRGVGRNGWVRNPYAKGLRELPISPQLRADLLSLETYRQPPRREDWAQWLDSMTYEDYLTQEVGIGREAVRWMDNVSAGTGLGVSCDAVSAYNAFLYGQPGPAAFMREEGKAGEPTDIIEFVVLPGGNGSVTRSIVKTLVPDAIEGASVREIMLGRTHADRLDVPGQPVRIRLNSTGVHVVHAGAANRADHVWVTYLRDGRLERVKARGVVMAGIQAVSRHVVQDLPAEHSAAMAEFHNAPMLVVNVALRHWSFLEELGVSAMRWFEGFGWFTSLRRPVVFDGEPCMPLDPAKPTVLSLYTPFPIPGLDSRTQATAARGRLFGMPFSDIELGVREQFTTMFAGTGFDATRDIAGIVANRWGHAYCVTPPGFFFDRPGRTAPSNVIRQRHGRIAFGNSDLAGCQTWEIAVSEGQRAVRQVLERI